MSKLRQEDISTRTSGTHISYWLESTKPLAFSSLASDIDVDVAIVGGGIAGITTAYLLAKEGKKVALLEDGLIGSGESGRTSAHLCNALDDRFSELEKKHGKEIARIFAESHTSAINRIERIVREENIDCDFVRVPGYLFLNETDELKSLEEEFEATKRVGLQTSWQNATPSVAALGPCILFENQAQFHPLKYLIGLCHALIRLGGQIYTNTHVTDFSKDSVTTATGKRVFANHLVVATNTPINDRLVIHTKQAPYRTYIVGGRIPAGSVPNALFWDTGDQNSVWHTQPYHYVRVIKLNNDEDLLLVGGEDHKVAQASENQGLSEEKRYQTLRVWAKRHFPMISEFIYQWSGQIMEPMDGSAFIGRNPMDSKNTFIITGDSGNGLTHGTIGAMLVTDLILDRKNSWEEAYAPNRIRISALPEFIEENMNAVLHLRDYFNAGELESLEALSNDQGAVLREGLNKVAFYKDEDGSLHAFSAVCPHLKCIVHWNQDEKSFDCPCHGSRFSSMGSVMNGPANVGLKALKLDEENHIDRYGSDENISSHPQP